MGGVTLAQGAPIPIAAEVGEGLGELTLATEERVYQHLGAVASNDPLASRVELSGSCVQPGASSAAEDSRARSTQSGV